MPETRCTVCEKNLILDEENVCAQCELIKETDKKIETYNNVDCGTCNSIVAENTEGLYCDVCDRWYHNGCCEFPLSEYLRCLLKEAPNNVKWCCDKCIWERERWINSMKVEIHDDGVSDDLSDIDIEHNLNARKRGRRPRRLDDDDFSDHKYDESNEPEVLIDERSMSTDYKVHKQRKKVKKEKKHRPKRKVRRKRRHSCDMCSKRFLDTETLEAHKLAHKGDTKPFKCTECDSSFMLKSGLKQHSFKHVDGKSFFCDICARGFKWKSTYMRHLRDYHSDEKLLQCSLCDFKTTNQSRVDAHMLKHSDARPFKCEKCDYAGKTTSHLKAHMITHSDERPHVCPECGKAYKKKEELKTHMYIHTGAWPFECAVCGSKFASETQLIVHARLHTGERPFACTLCDFRSRTKNALHKHMPTHSSERPFPCDICGMRLRTAGALKAHKMIHTGEKPHKCELCGKKCRLKSTLKRHMDYHAKTNILIFNKPYECEMCGNRYSTVKSMNRHKNGNQLRGPCQGDPILRKNDQKPDLPSFRDQDPNSNRFIIKPLTKKPAARKKFNLKPAYEQANVKTKEHLIQHNSQDPPSLQNLTVPTQNFQNPPSLLYAGPANNYQQYHEMFMNASSAMNASVAMNASAAMNASTSQVSQWTQQKFLDQNKFWN